MKRILLVSILFSSPVIAQLNLTAQVGLDARVPSVVNSIDSPFYEDTWTNGFGASLGADYSLVHNLLLAPSLQFAYYPFNQYVGRKSAIPEDPPAISSTGKGTTALRFMLDARLLASRKFVGLNTELYFTTGFGYTIQHSGKIHAIFGFGGVPAFERDLGDVTSSYWVHSLGIATRTSISEPFSLDVSVKYVTDYTNNFTVAVSAGIAYAIFQ